MSNFRQRAYRATPALKSVGKQLLIHGLMLAPAGISGWAIKSIARRPLRLLIAFALEPLLKKAASRLASRLRSPMR
ncbi:phage shock protein PspD [Mixta tenebrionis]|uniref:Phage shock protein PspD n=1 Tax=Mixta tenebrionis TaxID=2562439 RepID=A0A506VCC8_9GAMM|nr:MULTISPECIES: phage shock protein PspD [Mixta]QHM75415.1 Phage shock protein D [Mixta theicola]TPW43305.1 phage shock protein PspD [Mixta tenebrionis]